MLFEKQLDARENSTKEEEKKKVAQLFYFFAAPAWRKSNSGALVRNPISLQDYMTPLPSSTNLGCDTAQRLHPQPLVKDIFSPLSLFFMCVRVCTYVRVFFFKEMGALSEEFVLRFYLFDSITLSFHLCPRHQKRSPAALGPVTVWTLLDQSDSFVSKLA